MSKKTICVITSTRADYGYFRLILKKIINSDKLDLSLIVTGIHLLKSHGETIELITDDKIPISKIIPMYKENSSSKKDIGLAVGKAITEFTEYFYDNKPDVLLVLGDRFEPLAAVIAAAALSIPIAHIHGGDNVSKGQIDEQIRHSITKFSHIHFPASAQSYNRIKLLGEEEWRIHNVGSPSIDSIMHEKLLDKAEICTKLGLDQSLDIIVCLQHPYVVEAEQAGVQMKTTLEVLEELKFQKVIIYPNNDPGSELIINEIDKKKNVSNFKIFKNLGYIEYLSLLKSANLLIGNSSGGLIESPIFKLPIVNIGNRNKGRETAENVIHTSNKYEDIKNAILKGLSADFVESCNKVKNPYGDGDASNRIVKILEDLELNERLLVKELTYDV